MTKTIFTICSNNYLAQAKALGDSVIKHNPDYDFIIFLCDKKNSEIDYSVIEPHTIIEAHNIGINKFKQMSEQYNIIELNTSIKPFVFSYLFNNYKDIEYAMYFDPDTYVYDKLNSIEEELNDASILLTPHIYTPIEFDDKTPNENTFTQHGIYNLGFLALKKDKNSLEMLDWWMRRLEVNCYSRSYEGIFVDQLPMNFAPIFFKGVKISKNWGLNVAPWNLHERNLTIKNKNYVINDKYPLIFYHFSNCNPLDFELLSTYYTRVTFNERSSLKKAYDDYKKEILNNSYNKLSKIKCFYSKIETPPAKVKEISTIKKIIDYIKKYPLFLFRQDFWI